MYIKEKNKKKKMIKFVQKHLKILKNILYDKQI